MKYDAIIAGASFAGLTVASRLRGNILLIDKSEIGSGQTSACGTLLGVPEALGGAGSILQTYHHGYIHTPERVIEYDLPYPLCSFDYMELCRNLARRSKAHFIKARVLGARDGKVITDQGEFEGGCLIDATGWRAVMGSSFDNKLVDRSTMSFGIETTVSYQEEGLHFWMDPQVIDHGVGWLFPCGTQTRIGVGSYHGETDLHQKLSSFVNSFEVSITEVHGGFFPGRLRKPTVGDIFLVGDSAGQCEPLTGEGIRPAIYFGLKCSQIVQRVIDGEIKLEEGLARYSKLVNFYQRYYSFLEWFRKFMWSLPGWWQTRLLVFFGQQSICNFALDWYRKHAAI